MTTEPISQNLFTCIDHVGYAVPDLDQAIDLHTRVFGWRVVHREINEAQGVEEAMLVTGEANPMSAQLQLLAPLDESSPIATYLDRRGPGVQQICYRVDDLARVSQTLRSRGIRLLFDEPKQGTAGALINFIHPKDAGGVLVELTQPKLG